MEEELEEEVERLKKVIYNCYTILISVEVSDQPLNNIRNYEKLDECVRILEEEI